MQCELTETAQPTTAGIADGPVQNAGTLWARDKRRLSAETLDRLNVAFGTTFFPDAGAKHNAVFFKYPNGWKARAFPEKHFVAGKGFKLAFWNLERVIKANPADVFIVEGELDACALVESGISQDQVLSVPNGAKERPADDPGDQRGYEYVRDALKLGLNRVKKFIWCGDADGSGHALREDMVRLLGAARFWFVDWPEGCKDANEFLIKDGPAAVLDLVKNGALQWPVDGLYRLNELPEPAPLTLWYPGFAQWERKVMLAPRTLSVATGHPGHGKTAFWGQVWFQIVRQYSVPICVASFETRAKPHLRRQLRTLLKGKLERDMSNEEKIDADAWINDRYFFMAHKEQRPTLEWFLDMAEVAVVRHGARIIQLDPWNRLEASRGRDESETEYIGRCLRSLHVFAHDMNCHVQIVAHPAKMDSTRRGKQPGLEDISGSKNWENMVDQGFVIHRPQMFDGGERQTSATFFQMKARFEELGYPSSFEMNFDISVGKYKCVDYEQVGG